MKNLILILVLLISVVGISQNKQDRIKYEPLSKNLDLKLIEKEFNRLYLNYQDSVFKRNKKYGSFLDSMVHCQLNYLLGKERGGISHEQDNIEFKTLKNRFNHFGRISNIDVFSEILVDINNGSNEYVVSKIMFNCFLKSKYHKEILDDKEMTYYNFKFGYNKIGRLIGIGVFSNYLITMK